MKTIIIASLILVTFSCFVGQKMGETTDSLNTKKIAIAESVLAY
jgi:hypothetical protein